jgi:hypothetical protein
MAWTTPATFTAGQTLTAAQMNVMQDNLSALYASATNTKSTHLTSTWTSALNLSWQDVTGLAVSITPTSATSKVLVLATVHFGSTVTSGTNINGRVQRGSGAVTLPFVAARNVYQQAEWGMLQIAYLDSPATTSATTYQFQIVGSNGNTNYTYVNLRGDSAATATSSITVQEVPV